MKKRDIVAIMAVVLTAWGCNPADDGLRPGERVPIRLSAAVDGAGLAGSRTRSSTTTSTTQDTELLSGQAVDAYIKVKRGDWLDGLSALTPRHFEVTGSVGDLDRKSGEDVDYYPMDATPVEIYAVHPSVASEAEFTVKSDQTDADNYAFSDLCYSKTTEVRRSESKQTLTFKHVLSKIIVKVDVSGLGTPAPTVSNLRLRAKTKTALTFPVANDDGYELADASEVGSIQMNEGGAAIIPPQTTAADGDVRISFDLSGVGPIVYDFPAETTFDGNTQYTYTVKVGASVTVTSSIADWGTTTSNNKTVEIGRPKLPIEYCAQFNMMSKTEMAPNNHVSNIAYFYWGTNTSTMSPELTTFKNGITINDVKYHLPSKKEWVGLVGNTTYGDYPNNIGYGNGSYSDRVEEVAWGVTNNSGTYSYDVDRSFYNDYDYTTTPSKIGYGLRFRERVNSTTVNGRYTCAYRYEYVDNDDDVGNAATYLKVKYIGANQIITIETIKTEEWWNSITPDFELTFPATGHKNITTQYWPAGSFSKATGGTSQNERGYYWSCDKADGTNAYSMKPHDYGIFGWATDVPGYTFTVRLFKDAE